MKKEELKEAIMMEKKVISSRLATIDSLLDRMAYKTSSSDTDELCKESEKLEKQMDALRECERELDTVSSVEWSIAIAENQLDNLELLIGKKSEIAEVKTRISKLEAERDEIFSSIENNLKNFKK